MSTPTTTLTPEQLYQLIKEYEAEIPIPAPFVTVQVGTFDAAAGTFTGLTTEVIVGDKPEPGETNVSPPEFQGSEYVYHSINAQGRETVTRVPAPSVPVAPVLLQFNVTNFTGPWSVTVDGYTTNAAAGQASVSVNAWDITTHNWTLQAGAGGHQDRLFIQRTESIPAAGGFTIPLLPVAIAYAPPADSENKSTASYAQGDTAGTSITYDFNTDSNQTVEPVFADGTAFRSFLGVAAAALGGAGAAGTTAGTLDAAASKDVTAVLGMIPTDQTLVEEGFTTDNSSTVTTTFTSSTTIGTTTQGGGPGVGDVIVYFQDVLVAWAYNGGSLQLCPIGFSEGLATAAAIQREPGQLGLATSDQQLLLSLDPFVAGGPFAQPPADRFTQPPDLGLLTSISYSGGGFFNHVYTVTRDNKTISSTKSYTTDTNTFSPGEILQMFGVGTSKSQVTTTLTTATTGDVSQTVTLVANLVSGPDDSFVVTIWYDSLFGTWAFQQHHPTTQPVASGSGAAPGEVVTLESAGQVHGAVADAQGHYEFRAPNIAPGTAQVFVGNNPPTTVDVASPVGPFRGPISVLPPFRG
jgi:hypothetical protein